MNTERSQPRGGRRGLPSAATAPLGSAGLMALALTLYGDAGAVADALAPPQPPPPAATSTAAAPSLPYAEPVRLEIPAIELRTEHLVPLGLRPNGEIEVPRDYAAVGWYANGPAPGQVGAAVIGGHVDSRTAPAVFHRLDELAPGDTVVVERADGVPARFTVYQAQQHAKDDFPTERVYGPTGGRAELRLVTCGGEFDTATRSYRDNTVVYARLAPDGP